MHLDTPGQERVDQPFCQPVSPRLGGVRELCGFPDGAQDLLQMMMNGADIADGAAQNTAVPAAVVAAPGEAPVITVTAPTAPPAGQIQGAAPPAQPVVHAVAVPTTKKPAGSREAIVIGFANNPEQFQVAMKNAPCEEPCYFCFGCMFPCCAAFHIRKKMLGENFETEYSCCQMEAVGFKPCCGSCCSCWKSCPTLGLCCEAWCCTGLSLSFTRIHAMQKFNVRPDPCDYTCIQFSNCVQAVSCVCHCLAIFHDGFKSLADCVDCAADCVFHMTAGCVPKPICVASATAAI